MIQQIIVVSAENPCCEDTDPVVTTKVYSTLAEFMRDNKDTSPFLDRDVLKNLLSNSVFVELLKYQGLFITQSSLEGLRELDYEPFFGIKNKYNNFTSFNTNRFEELIECVTADKFSSVETGLYQMVKPSCIDKVLKKFLPPAQLKRYEKAKVTAKKRAEAARKRAKEQAQIKKTKKVQNALKILREAGIEETTTFSGSLSG